MGIELELWHPVEIEQCMRAWFGFQGTLRVEVKARFGLSLSGLLMFDLGQIYGFRRVLKLYRLSGSLGQ